MKFALTKTNRDDYYDIKDFETIEELIAFKKRAKCPIIILSNSCYGESIKITKEYNPCVDANELITIPYAIEIYNDYRE